MVRSTRCASAFTLRVPGSVFSALTAGCRAALDRVLAAAAVLAVLLLVFPALGAASALALAAAIPFLGPLFAASRRNAALRAHPHAALLLGTLRARPTRTSKGVPALRVVISAEDATAQAVVPASPALQALMTEGRPVLARALVFAHDPTFRSIDRVADVYVPALDAFLAKYPYVRRRPFFELSNHADDLMRVSPDLFVVD